MDNLFNFIILLLTVCTFLWAIYYHFHRILEEESSRKKMVRELQKPKVFEIYENYLEGGLNWLQSFFGASISFKALLICIALSLYYSAITFIFAWASGGFGKLGTATVLPESTKSYDRILVIICMSLLSVFILRSSLYLRKHNFFFKRRLLYAVSRLSLKKLSYKYSGKISRLLIAFATGTFGILIAYAVILSSPTANRHVIIALIIALMVAIISRHGGITVETLSGVGVLGVTASLFGAGTGVTALACIIGSILGSASKRGLQGLGTGVLSASVAIFFSVLFIVNTLDVDDISIIVFWFVYSTESG